MQFLAISGSLRAGSSNTAVLEAARLVAPAGVEVFLYEGLAALPAFNPDQDTMEGGSLPPEADDLRTRVGRADGILVCSPEYAHGIPGSLKNLLDWLVGSVEFPGKPVALISASSRSVHVQAQLVEVLMTMSARLINEASIVLAIPPGTASAKAIVSNADLGSALQGALAAMATAINTGE
ncbi:MAG: NAD(P)H-dependent oxidoreductase [Dehalococcoidia bacterium]|nr:NAD(P)H-dependent oxidoreductase [Dehalococcoidia bacterium]